VVNILGLRQVLNVLKKHFSHVHDWSCVMDTFWVNNVDYLTSGLLLNLSKQQQLFVRKL